MGKYIIGFIGIIAAIVVVTFLLGIFIELAKGIMEALEEIQDDIERMRNK